MTYESILKELSLHAVRPNLVDYDAERRAFTWEGARSALVGQGDGGLNMAVEAVDRHADGGLGDKVALRWIGKTDRRRELTYSDLAEESARFANTLVELGVARGERVFIPVSGGYVRLTCQFGGEWGTAHPSIKVLEFDANGVDVGSGNDRAINMNRIARVWHQHRVARVERG